MDIRHRRLVIARDTLSDLIAARALIADIGNWTQFAFARTADGQTCVACDPSAKAFCVEGALLHVRRDLLFTGRALNRAVKVLFPLANVEGMSLVALNDAVFSDMFFEGYSDPMAQVYGISGGRRRPSLRAAAHAVILRVFDKAIELFADIGEV